MSTFEFDDMFADMGDKNLKMETVEIGPNPAGLPAAPAAPTAAEKRTPVAAEKRQIYTVMAQQGLNAAEVVNVAMQKRVIGTLTPRRIEVIAPHGPSTSGGKRARQSITLVPVSGQGAGIVFGFLDVAAKCFELRPYAIVAQQFKARFGEPFEATSEEYAALGRDLGKILGTLGFQQVEAKLSASGTRPLDDAEDEGEDDEYDEYDVLGGPTKQQKLMMLGAGVVATIVITLWWLK